MIISAYNQYCVIFKIELDGKIKEIARFQSDFAETPRQNDVDLNYEGELLSTGG